MDIEQILIEYGQQNSLQEHLITKSNFQKEFQL
jgi:hypothetical protein